MGRQVGVFVCCLLAVAAGALPAMGNGWPNTWRCDHIVRCYTTSEPCESVPVQQWGDPPVIEVTPFDSDGTAIWWCNDWGWTWCESGAPVRLRAPLVVATARSMFVFHHWDDRDPGVNTAYYEFCEDGQVTAHYQLLSSGSPPRALHINIAYVDLPGAAFPDLPVPARVDPPDYYGIASRSTAYGGADFLYLGRLPSVVVTVPHAVQTGEGQIRPFDH